MKPLLTPSQHRNLQNPALQALISRFDCLVFSSPQALANLKISHRIASILHQPILTGSQSYPKAYPILPPLNLRLPTPILPSIPYWAPTAPPLIDLNAKEAAAHDAEIARLAALQALQATLPPGVGLDPKGNRIFVRNWKEQGIHPSQLPHDHPDYCEF